MHNNPETLKLPSHFKHYRAELPDIESADISSLFNATYEFIEQARAKGQGERLAAFFPLAVAAFFIVARAKVSVGESRLGYDSAVGGCVCSVQVCM